MLPRLPVNLLRNEWELAWRRPSRHPVDRSRHVDQARRQTVRLKPSHRRLAHDDRSCRGDVGIDAGACRHSGRAPGSIARKARDGVDDVVELNAAPCPPANCRTRSRDPSGGDADRLLTLLDGRAAVLTGLDDPALVGWLARDCDIAAEAHQDASTADLR